MKKIKNKKIILAMLVVIAVSLYCTSVFAAITPDTSEKMSLDFGFLHKALEAFGSLALKPIVLVAIAMAIILTTVVGSVFSLFMGMTNSGDDTKYFVPWPDLIVFNKLASFDPNFINPAVATKEGEFSLIQIMSKVVSPLYFTGQTLVGGIFIILALIIGIKLAISATAQEKAQYKTAISKWVIGLFFLLVGHLFMAGVFSLNEKIVATVSAEADNLKLPIAVLEMDGLLSGIGNLLQVGINLFTPFKVDIGTYALVENFSGLVMFHIYNVITSLSFTSILIWFILLGQILALAALYFKRMFYAIFLGIIYPFTVAADTAQKIMGKSSNLLDNWIKTFVINVFTQTFHAFIMYFSLIIICSVVGIAGTDASSIKWAEGEDISGITKVIRMGDKNSDLAANAASILQVIALTSIVSMEKLIREFTGVKSGRTGDLKGNALQMYGGFKLAQGGYKNVKDNYTGKRDAQKKMAAARIERYKVEEKIGKTVDKNYVHPELERLKNAKSLDEAYKKNTAQKIWGAVNGDSAIDKQVYKAARGLKAQEDAFTKAYEQAKKSHSSKRTFEEMQKNGALGSSPAVGTSTNTTTHGFNGVNNDATNRINENANLLNQTQAAKRREEEYKNLANLQGSMANSYSALQNKFEAEFDSKLEKDNRRDKLEQELAKAISDHDQAKIEKRKKNIAAALSPGIALAGIGVGMGVANSLDDVLKVGGGITTALDRAVERSAQTLSKKTIKIELKPTNNEEKSSSKKSTTKTVINEVETTSNTQVINPKRLNK